jgi:hypothetical protein
MCVQHSVEAALGTDIKAMVGQDWHDLAWRQEGEFALVASEQDSLAFLLSQAMRHLAATDFVAIHAFPIPANCLRHRCSVYKPTPMSLASSMARAPAAIPSSRISGLLVIVRGRQSFSSSYQKAWIFYGDQQCCRN